MGLSVCPSISQSVSRIIVQVCKMYVCHIIAKLSLRSYSTTPNVDGDREDPIPNQACIKKLMSIRIEREVWMPNSYSISVITV